MVVLDEISLDQLSLHHLGTMNDCRKLNGTLQVARSLRFELMNTTLLKVQLSSVIH